MNPTTTKLLATLEILNSGKTFFWDATQGEFNLWNLMINQGFVNPTDVELVFEHWQNIETWGTPTNQALNDYEYAPPRAERKENNWNEEIENQRREYYQELQQLLKTNLYNIQAYNLRVPKSTDNYFEWDHPDFSVSIIVAQTKDNRWFCLAPTVPNQVDYSWNRKTTIQNQPTQAPNAEIQTILTNLTPIENYGYYDGGYRETYQHHIVSAIGDSREEVFATALQAANMVLIEDLTTYNSNDCHNTPELHQFMKQNLQSTIRYNIGFWDIGYTYEIGQTPAGDWIGTTSEYEFEYNP